MKRVSVCLLVFLFTACEEPAPPPQGPWRIVSADVEEGIVVERGNERRTVRLAGIRFPEWTEDRDLFHGHVQEALTEVAVGREISVRGDDDAADLRGEGRWVNREIVEAGWARPAQDADEAIVAAEAAAREAGAGAWGTEMKTEVADWVRAQADGLVVEGTHDVATERRLRWEAAREEHSEMLAFFEIRLPREPPGPATCRDRLRQVLGDTEPVSPRELTREMSVLFGGAELYRVVALAPSSEGHRPLACRRYAIRDLGEEGRELAAGWTEADESRVLEHLAFEVRTGEEPTVDITGARQERGGESVTRNAEGAMSVTALIDGGLVIGRMGWLATEPACQTWLSTMLRTHAPDCQAR